MRSNSAATRPCKAVVLLLIVALFPASLPSQQTPSGYTFRSRTELVLVNITVRDKNGNFVRDLKQDNFTVLEDNKSQQVASFDIENTDVVPPSQVPQTALLTGQPASAASAPNSPQPEAATLFKDRRLIVLFFDLTSMQPDEIDRAVVAAENYVDKQMTPADLVSVVSLGSSLIVNQDFTSDHALLKTWHD